MLEGKIGAYIKPDQSLITELGFYTEVIVNGKRTLRHYETLSEALAEAELRYYANQYNLSVTTIQVSILSKGFKGIDLLWLNGWVMK